MELKEKLFSENYGNYKNIKLNSILKCAEDAAKLAGDYALKNKKRRNETIKRFKHDVKLALDRECQKIVSREINKKFPSHHILGEEDEEHKIASDNSFWIIDPIDGTVNFSHGIPFWCCSVAYTYQGAIVAGAVYAPELKRLYSATIKSKAKCNGELLAISNTNNIEKTIVLTGLDKKEENWGGNFRRLKTLAIKTQKVRILGSAALDICFVASGLADCYFENYVYLWDVAAAGLILKQAGGCCKILKYNPATHQLSFIATNRNLYKNFLKLIQNNP
jgi:myo-inositol-1(or 4)-monophosphatase